MLVEFWAAYICVALAAFFNAIMDYCNFRKEENDGYFSIHTDDRWDAWHHSKKAMYACFFLWGLALYFKQPDMDQVFTVLIWSPIIFGFIILITHYFFYHKVFKNLKENTHV